MEYPLIHPFPGWNELDPNLVLYYVKETIKKANQKVKKDRVSALAISCQGEAIIPIDKEGNCLYNAIVTFDGRTKEQYEFWKENLGSSAVFKITGMPLNPMYSINKIMWLKKHRRDIFKSNYKFLCFEDFIQLKLGLPPSISYSLAARTAAFDIVKKQWSDFILREAKIDSAYLANPVEAAEIIGEVPKSVSEEL
jgi:xylulokinase